MSIRWELWLHKNNLVWWHKPQRHNSRPPSGPGWTRHGWVRVSRQHPHEVLSPEEDLPEGSVLANTQVQHCGLGGPRRFYFPMMQPCRACGQTFTFSTDEQKYWYETLRFWNESVPNKCPPCRHTVRRYRKGQHALMEAIQAIEENPADADALMKAARATRDIRDLVGDSALERAVGYAREAMKTAALEEEAGPLVEALRALRTQRDEPLSVGGVVEE